MKRKLFTITFVLALVAAILTAVAATDADPMATVGGTSYTDLQKAVDESNGQLVKLEANGGDITVNGDISIDLNGFSINSVKVQSGTLYGMDSSTDNYDNPDNCGKIGTVSGSVTGLASESTLAQDGYLMICEDTEAQTQVSFHRVNLRIYEMVLRGDDAGVYYKCNFEGDKLVADNVEKFGVALSIEDIPDADNLDTDCGYSYFTGFQAGANANDADSTSTLLYNVMDETLPDLANTHRANLPVYGRAYILTKNNQYVFGTATGTDANAPCTFKWLTQQADARLPGYSKDQVAGAVGLYKKFSKVMAKWDVDNIESALCLNTKDPL